MIDRAELIAMCRAIAGRCDQAAESARTLGYTRVAASLDEQARGLRQTARDLDIAASYEVKQEKLPGI